MIGHLQESLLIMSAQGILRKRNLHHFSPLPTDSFALTSFVKYKDQSLVK